MDYYKAMNVNLKCGNFSLKSEIKEAIKNNAIYCELS